MQTLVIAWLKLRNGIEILSVKKINKSKNKNKNYIEVFKSNHVSFWRSDAWNLNSKWPLGNPSVIYDINESMKWQRTFLFLNTAPPLII